MTSKEKKRIRERERYRNFSKEEKEAYKRKARLRYAKLSQEEKSIMHRKKNESSKLKRRAIRLKKQAEKEAKKIAEKEAKKAEKEAKKAEKEARKKAKKLGKEAKFLNLKYKGKSKEEIELIKKASRERYRNMSEEEKDVYKYKVILRLNKYAIPKRFKKRLKKKKIVIKKVDIKLRDKVRELRMIEFYYGPCIYSDLVAGNNIIMEDI